jgi:hypothetical protein
MTATSLSLAVVRRINWKIVASFLNMMEKLTTENNFSDPPGNIFNVDGSGNQINNKRDSAISEKCYKNAHVVPTGERSENITEVACCSAAGQLLLPTVISKYVNKTQDFGDGLRPGQMCT